MQRKQWKAPPAKKAVGDTPERQPTKPAAVEVEKKKKKEKPRTIDDVIELLHKHGIRFNDEE